MVWPWKSWLPHVVFLSLLNIDVKVSDINYSTISCLKTSNDGLQGYVASQC